MTAKCLKLRLFLLASGLVKLTGRQTLLLVNKVGLALQRGGLGGRALQLCLVINLCAAVQQIRRGGRFVVFQLFDYA